ncbi:hypothetical protein ACS8Y6_17790 [Salinisphaera sp. RV14]|uniref:hypothetical protein n=1 Tax=unclassified Salinisphaera TaxID=2649847 RepID=UPI003F87A6BE
MDLVINERSVRVSKLTHPALAVVDGHIPQGRLVAGEIRRSVSLLEHHYSHRESERLEQLAQVAEGCHSEFHRDPSRARGSMHPLAGVLAYSYYYGALVPRRGEHAALGILRAALLRVITKGLADTATRSAARRIRDVLTTEPTRQFDDAVSPALAEAWSDQLSVAQFARLITPYLAEHGDAAEKFANAAMLPADGALRRPDATKPAEPRPSPPRTPRRQAPPSSLSPATPIRPSGLFGVRHFVPPLASLDVPPPDEIPPEDIEGFQPAFALDLFQQDDEPLEVASGEKLATAAFEFEQATRHHLEGVLLPDTDRTLTTIETQRVWNALTPALDLDFASLMDKAAALCAALMLVTGRRRIECLYAIAHLAQDSAGTVDGALRLSTHSWATTLQALPELNDLPSDWFHRTSLKLSFPLPPPLSRALSVLHATLTAEALTDLGRNTGWESAWADLRSQLREVCPRFTETRAIHTLAVQTFVRTGHIREAQWFSGSALEHSSAPSHYYARSAHELVSTYCDALSAMGIPAEKPSTSDNSLIGAPRAAIRWETACTAIESLCSRTKDAVRLGKAPTDTVLEGVHALGAYLAILFGVCTAHRFTAPIGAVTRRDVLTPTGSGAQWSLGLVGDKTTDPELDARVCVLPPLFTDTLHAYLRQLERAERLLAKRGVSDDVLLERIRAALDGTGPLWFTGGEHAVGAKDAELTRHGLKALWPEWVIPMPLLRHLFASNAGRFGIAGSDIALQMGHSIGDSPFDACDPDCPAEFGERIAANLQSYVEALGFRTVGAARRYDPPAPLEPRSAQDLVTDYKTLRTLRRGCQETKLDEPTEIENQRAAEIVDAFDGRTPTNADDEWLIEPAAIQQLLNQSQAETLGVQQALRSKLSALVAHRRRTMTNGPARRRPFVPPLSTPNITYSAFNVVHFDASRWALAVEAQALALLDRGVASDDDHAILAATTILLASYGAGTTSDRLLHLLDPDLPLHAFEQFESGLIAEVPLDASGNLNGERECQLVSGDAVALLGNLRRRRIAPPTLKQIDTALRKQAELQGLWPAEARLPLDDLLLLIGLGRQCHIPGTRSAWERGILNSVGPALTRFAPLISADISATVPQHLSGKRASPGQRTLTRNDGMTAYRQLRRLAYEIAAGRDTAANRRRLRDLEERFALEFGSSSLIALLAAFVVYLRHERGLADTSTYDYLTTLGARLIRGVGAGDIHAIDPWDIEGALRQIAIESRSGERRAKASTVASAASHFSDVLDRVGVEIDLSRAFDGLAFETQRHPGYFSSQTETTAIQSALATTTDHALASLSLDSGADHATIGEAGALIQMYSGLRLSEVAGLMSRDLMIDDERLSIHVHPIKRRQLKTVASRRIVIAPMETQAAARLRGLLGRLGIRVADTGDLLLAPDVGTGVASIARMMASGFRVSASSCIEGPYARGHIARHNMATTAVLVTHPARMAQPVASLKPVTLYEHTQARIISLGQLPRRLQFRYLSRQLGHGSPITTLVWYAHALPLLHGQVSPWRGLARQAEARLLDRRASDIDRWRGHHGGTHVENIPFLMRFRPDWISNQVHPYVEKTTANAPRTPATTTTSSDTSQLTASLAGRIALAVRMGVDDYAAANQLWMRVEQYKAIVALLSERDRGFRLGYLTGRRIRPRGHKRIPRSHDLGLILRSIDESLDAHELTGTCLRRWLLRNLAAEEPALSFDVETAGLAAVVGRHKRAERVGDHAAYTLIEVPKSDRQLILLVIATISWLKRA